MKNRYAIALFLFGMVVMTVGALFKIMHWPAASLLLISATLMETVALLVIIVKLLRGKDGEKFLDK